MSIDKNKNVVHLIDARFKKKRGSCQHNHIYIDDDYEFVRCTECDEYLNPIKLLLRMSAEENRLDHLRKAIKQEKADLAIRKRFKCQHCSKISTL